MTCSASRSATRRSAGSTRVPDELKRRARAGPRCRARLPLGVPQGSDKSGEADPGLTQAKGSVAGPVRDRRPDGGLQRGRRALAQRGRRPDPAAAVRRAAPGLGPDARQAAHRQGRRLHQRDPAARRRLQHGRVELRPQDQRADPRRTRAPRETDRRRPAVARPRRRQPVRLRPAGDPLRRLAPAAAGPRRPRRGPARGDRRARRRRRRAAPSACSRAAVPPRPPPRRSANGSRT